MLNMAMMRFFELGNRDVKEFLGDCAEELSRINGGLERVDGLIKDHLNDEWSPSEHVEAVFRNIQLMGGLEPDPWPTEALERANAAKCTFYFSYHKHLAMFGAQENKSNRSYTTYMDQLAPWKEQIESGLTTFAENPEPTRSDCHAWSAHPILGFFQIVAGVTSVAPAWKKARIMPHPGNLKRFDARIAHPDGELRVAYDDGLLTIDSPVPFELRWRGRSDSLASGRHTIS